LRVGVGMLQGIVLGQRGLADGQCDRLSRTGASTAVSLDQLRAAGRRSRTGNEYIRSALNFMRLAACTAERDVPPRDFVTGSGHALCTHPTPPPRQLCA
jgi:hypothetical protein